MATTNYKKLEKELYNLQKEHQLLKEEQIKSKNEQIKFKKEQNNKFRRFVVFAVILCLVLSGITGVASYSLAATQVGYTPKDTSWTVQNTGDAIDELRDNIGASLVGSIFSYMGTTAPYGYLACDGTEYNIADYPRLANHINAHFGSTNYFGGDGTTTFAVPDLTGKFLKGNTVENVGINEEAGLPNITGTIGWKGSESTYSGAFYTAAQNGFTNSQGISSGSGGRTIYFSASNSNSIYGKSTTVTPTNTSVLYIIKY